MSRLSLPERIVIECGIYQKLSLGKIAKKTVRYIKFRLFEGIYPLKSHIKPLIWFFCCEKDIFTLTSLCHLSLIKLIITKPQINLRSCINA